MIIRSEKESDIKIIFDITKDAFENHPYSQHTEQFIINALRNENALTISLVAEIEGKVVLLFRRFLFLMEALIGMRLVLLQYNQSRNGRVLDKPSFVKGLPV